MAVSSAGAGAPRQLRVLVDGPGRGAWNMALDEALMDAARSGLVTLRLYGWDPPCLSFGRNQVARGRYDGEAAVARGIDLVRRPTGGRAVYHDRELTYAVTAPERLWGGPREAYARINRALGRGLGRLGARVELAARAAAADRPWLEARACFADPAPGEVTALGRKLVGSAVWRRAGALLQHGSVLLHDDQRVAEELGVGGGSGSGGEGVGGEAGAARGPPPSIGLVEACGSPPPLEALVDALVKGFEAELGLPARTKRPTTAERGAARRRAATYADPGWTWRR